MKTTPNPKLKMYDHRTKTQVCNWHSSLFMEHNKAGRAALRRATKIDDVLLQSEFWRLMEKLVDKEDLPFLSPMKLRQVAAVAMVLAHVTPGSRGTKLGQQMAKAGLSQQRFETLLHAQSVDEAASLFRNSVTFMKGNANAADIVEILGTWQPELNQYGERPRMKLARSYFLS